MSIFIAEKFNMIQNEEYLEEPEKCITNMIFSNLFHQQIFVTFYGQHKLYGGYCFEQN